MKFDRYITVEGKYIYGKIRNDEFTLSKLANGGRVLPPLTSTTTYLFNSKELGELINELELVKDKIDSK